MHPELESLINAIVEDGHVTDKEREALHLAATRLGISEIEADFYLEVAVARRLRAENSQSASQHGQTANAGRSGFVTCPACGAPIDSLLSACNFCGTAIQSRGMDSLSDEQLIRKAAEWIDKIPDGTIAVVSAGETKVMQRGEISGMAAQYISVLRVRAQDNPRLAEAVRHLEQRHERFNRKISSEAKTLICFALLMGFMSIMWARAERQVQATVKDLNVLEASIQREIAAGHYSAARSLVVQLEWPNADETEADNQDWSKKYAEKRRAYNEAIAGAETQTDRR